MSAPAFAQAPQTPTISSAAAQSPLAVPHRTAELAVLETGASDPFSALVGKRTARRSRQSDVIQVERYVIATDDRAFLFAKNGEEARVKFLCREGDPRLDCVIDPDRSAEEVFLLRATTGPRGDIIFKDAGGGMFLRIASYGGATVFWPGAGKGEAAAKSFGDQTSLRLPFADVATAARRAQLATAFLSAQTGAPIVIDFGTPALDETTGAAVLADAIVRAASGVQAVAQDEVGAKAISRQIRTIKLVAADVPELSMDGTTLEVRYNPAQDLSGRPSSAAVARFLEETL